MAFLNEGIENGNNILSESRVFQKRRILVHYFSITSGLHVAIHS